MGRVKKTLIILLSAVVLVAITFGLYTYYAVPVNASGKISVDVGMNVRYSPDPDVAINTAVHSTLYAMGRGGIFWTSTTVGYVVFVDSANDLVYQKTSDGGANWAAQQTIKAGTVTSYDCWADWQTAGDSGTKIHIAYADVDTDDIRYIYLDTSTDTVSGDDQIEACQGTGSLSTSSGIPNCNISITKTRGGNIAVAFHYKDSDNTNFYGFYTSPDATTWTSRTSLWEASPDYLILFPANLVDSNDLWATFCDITADEISLKTFDDSGNSWSEDLISGSIDFGFSSVYQMNGQIRLSDGHLIFAAWNLYNNAAADLMVWDITDGSTITAKTNIITNEAGSICVSVFINQVNNDIYVAYVSGTAAGSLVACFYQKSTDGGVNWGGETAMQDDAEDDERWVSCGCMKASWGGRFAPVWFNDDLNDLFCNAVAAITISASGGTPDISNTPSSENIGNVAESSTYYAYGSAPSNPVQDGECTFTVTNNSGAAVDITIKATNWTGGDGWTLTNGSPGSGTVRMTAYYSGQNPASGVILTTSEQSFISGLADSATKKWDFKLETGTFTDGVQKTSTITLTASLS